MPIRTPNSRPRKVQGLQITVENIDGTTENMQVYVLSNGMLGAKPVRDTVSAIDQGAESVYTVQDMKKIAGADQDD